MLNTKGFTRCRLSRNILGTGAAGCIVVRPGELFTGSRNKGLVKICINADETIIYYYILHVYNEYQL